MARRRSGAGGRRCRAWAGREPAHSGQGSAKDERTPAGSRRPQLRDSAVKTDLRGRRHPWTRNGEAEPRQGFDRGFYDRRQRRDRPLSCRTKIPFLAARGADAETLGQDRRACPAARIQAPQ